MAKKIKANKDVIILLVEGATEVEFYKKLLRDLYKKYNPKNCEIRQPINMEGIGNYKNGAVRQFEREVGKFQKSKKYNREFKYVYYVFMCIDTDVFEFHSNPPIDKENVKKAIADAGGIPHYIEACHSIEDWFLEDRNGIADFLHINITNLKINGKNGAEKINKLFEACPNGKNYIKGEQCKGLVENLDVMKIFNNHQAEFSELINLLK